MKLSDFDYKLPDELIAAYPAEPRDSSRLMVVDRKSGQISDRHFFDIVDYLNAGDLLVVNNSKVYPARIIGKNVLTDGKVEILLNHEVGKGSWEVIGRNLKAGAKIIFDNSALVAQIEKGSDEIFCAKFNIDGAAFFNELEKIGHTPLPPYILKKRGNIELPADKERYQTVYAKGVGSAAAPTAGLHFTPELMNRIREKGVRIIEVTLHVGLGTFAPIKEEDFTKHKMHKEYFVAPNDLIDEVIKTKAGKHRVLAVGTTSIRVLETIFQNFDSCLPVGKVQHSAFNPPPKMAGWTDIFIYPGYKFHCVDGLITNFHVPKSSLLLLVSAFASPEIVKKSYQSAIDKKYRFFSFGDAMFFI